MYTEMRMVDRLSLDDLQSANPQLYMQICQTAEASLSSQRLEPPEPIPILPPAILPEFNNVIVRAFVGEVSVTVNLNRAAYLASHLQEISENNTLESSLRTGCRRASERLRSLLDDPHTPPPLPTILLGTIPLPKRTSLPH